MMVYVPYYTGRIWAVQPAESEYLRKPGRCWEYKGTIYGEAAYTTEAAAWDYIEKRYFSASKCEYHG